MSIEDEIKKLEAELDKKREEIKDIKKKINELKAKSKTQGKVKPKSGGSILGVPVDQKTRPKSSGRRREKKVILQKIPTSGTSQIKGRETQYECPQCGSHYNTEIDDKSKILYIDGAGTRIYGKKHRCLNCGNEWAE
ncbi:MAG: hypothetical protein GF329_16900 [Candidatus Lokiarchaeota archaeon]|nr:hypothetical protein [Candidatus Lokiarchaeota archaeon]